MIFFCGFWARIEKIAVDIAAWLRDLGLEQYERAFLDQDINADLLPQLTADHLITVGVASVVHRRKLLNATVARRRSQPPNGCDLVDSTRLATRLDPEDLREVMGIEVMCQERPSASKSLNHFVGAQQWPSPIPSLESRG
jgi:SAM domain (Sterile alpha motif)